MGRGAGPGQGWRACANNLNKLENWLGGKGRRPPPYVSLTIRRRIPHRALIGLGDTPATPNQCFAEAPMLDILLLTLGLGLFALLAGYVLACERV